VVVVVPPAEEWCGLLEHAAVAPRSAVAPTAADVVEARRRKVRRFISSATPPISATISPYLARTAAKGERRSLDTLTLHMPSQGVNRIAEVGQACTHRQSGAHLRHLQRLDRDGAAGLCTEVGALLGLHRKHRPDRRSVEIVRLRVEPAELT